MLKLVCLPKVVGLNVVDSSSKKRSKQMQEPLTFGKDLEALEREYSDMLRSVEILDQHNAKVVTLECDTFHVALFESGWTVTDGDKHKGDVYETMEAMLMVLSTQFTQLWHKRLTDKLEDLEKFSTSN